MTYSTPMSLIPFPCLTLGRANSDVDQGDGR